MKRNAFNKDNKLLHENKRIKSLMQEQKKNRERAAAFDTSFNKSTNKPSAN